MTKRYYYTCPVKALYMQKEFGVEFELQEVKVGVLDSFKSHPFSSSEAGDKFFVEFSPLLGDKVYVAPKSEGIFEPKEGDFGVNNYGNIQTIYEIEEGDGRWRDTVSHGTSRSIDNSKIIMRDNKNFFMPEVEQ